jgi:hypothetical protein
MDQMLVSTTTAVAVVLCCYCSGLFRRGQRQAAFMYWSLGMDEKKKSDESIMNGESVRLAIVPFVVFDKDDNGVLTRERGCLYNGQRA